MCHPAADIDIKDPISQSRIKEFAYFNSKQALQDQKDHNIVL
ncbi:hypothetical protein [Francisella tularensis]|nr:hypothetical protein [Francisella tularensis]AJI45038.1 hypothetical protein AS84_136 [Francisella tularensis subsp. novicida F6168]